MIERLIGTWYDAVTIVHRSHENEVQQTADALQIILIVPLVVFVVGALVAFFWYRATR